MKTKVFSHQSNSTAISHERFSDLVCFQ